MVKIIIFYEYGVPSSTLIYNVLGSRSVPYQLRNLTDLRHYMENKAKGIFLKQTSITKQPNKKDCLFIDM